MGIKSLLSAAHAAGFAMASSEDLLKSSNKPLTEIGGHEDPLRPAYTYAPVIDRDFSRSTAITSPTVARQPIPAARALVPVTPKTDSYERLRHYCQDWLGWLSGRAIA